MKRTAVVFQAPGRVEAVREDFPSPPPGWLAVETEVSAISAGSELLFYRGEAPAGMAVDPALAALAGPIGYPVRYGYAAVGRAAGAGPRLFCFHPHASRMSVPAADAVAIPPDIAPRDALFLAAMETAVTLVLDGAPRIGERVAVFGQGVVGLLLTALLAQHPLARLCAVEPSAFRRRAALEAGAHAALDPAEAAAAGEEDGADLVYELSGNPRALDQAVAAAGFAGRVVVGSWYGAKPCRLDLGGRFHRSRIRIVSSQVSTLPPALGGRWDRARRFAVAWEMIRRVAPSRWITHEFAVERAAEAYALLDRGEGGEALQVVLKYG